MVEGFDWVERDRGILTKRDREFLLGELDEDLSENSRNVKRYDIRNRILNALYDFEILSGNLLPRDYEQIFEPAYSWGRERRHLDEKGRTSASPEFSPFLRGWLSAIEFFATGFYIGGPRETRRVMRGIVNEGIERGFRLANLSSEVRQPISADLQIEFGRRKFIENYRTELKSGLPQEPDKRAEEVLKLSNERKISQRVAREWIQYDSTHRNTD